MTLRSKRFILAFDAGQQAVISRQSAIKLDDFRKHFEQCTTKCMNVLTRAVS